MDDHPLALLEGADPVLRAPFSRPDVRAAGERPLPTFASRGEQRSAVLALKLAEADWIRAHIGEPPIFLLDDVLSELDTAHREALCRALPDGAQTLLTAAVLTSIPEVLRKGATVTEIARTQ